jgi:threonylcarbamoyladenosine tRNA methylthiotransferase MtaB
MSSERWAAVPADGPLVALRTLGCKVNRSESDALAEALALLGIAVSAETAGAGAIVVNTCTVTGEADAKARKEIRRALAATDGAVIVTGCLAALDADGLRALDPRVTVETDRSALPTTVARLLDGASTGPVAATAPGSRPLARTRALVKIQDGCDNRCAYCIVPDARGAVRSVPADTVVAKVAALHRSGAAEVVLTGVNIGRYEDAAAPDLAALVRRVADTGIRRIRISSIESPDLDARLLGALAAAPSVAPHLHVPLQSGCDRTLSAMRRRYDAAAYADTLLRARATLPGLAVTTDVIAGFPGESDADFEESLAFVRACGFTKLHVFRYSTRAGTPAAAYPAQVDACAKSERAERLRELGSELEAAHARARAGTRATLLVEAAGGGVMRGTTEDYLRVAADLPGAVAGDLLPVILRASELGMLRAYHVGRDD